MASYFAGLALLPGPARFVLAMAPELALPDLSFVLVLAAELVLIRCLLLPGRLRLVNRLPVGR